MLLTSLGFGPRLCNVVPKLTRSIVSRGALREIPEPRVFPPIATDPKSTRLHINTPSEFLAAIGRSCQEKTEPGSWDAFWRTTGYDMKKAGLTVRDRRYILWCMEKYRSGLDPREFAHEPKPKKSIRGWGPAVQNGKRIRSRRFS